MTEPFIGARVRVNNKGRASHGLFGAVVNTLTLDHAIVKLDGGSDIPYPFSSLELTFDKFDRVHAFGPNDQHDGRGQVLRQIPKDEPAWAGWFVVQLDKEPVGSTRNYPYNNLRFVEACPHVDDFRIGDHIEILPSDPCYSGKRGVVRAFRGGQVEVDFGDEKGTYAHAKDLMKVVDTVWSQQRILEQISNGIISKKTACDVLGIPEKVMDGITQGLGVPAKYLFPELTTKNKKDAEDYMRSLQTQPPKETIFRVKVKNDTTAEAKQKQLEKEVAFAKQYGISEHSLKLRNMLKGLYNGADPMKRETGTPMGVIATTVSATIVLASGREVRMPDPNPEKWELFETRSLGPASRVRARLRAPSERVSYLVISHCAAEGKDEEQPEVRHETGRCWLKDMTRIVNMTQKPDHFTTKYAYVTELRLYKERVLDAVFDDDLAFPTLRAYLW